MNERGTFRERIVLPIAWASGFTRADVSRNLTDKMEDAHPEIQDTHIDENARTRMPRYLYSNHQFKPHF